MKRRYALYATASAALLVLLATTSYGVLLFASILGMFVLATSIIAWIGVFSISERVAQRAVRIWKAVVPSHFSSTLFRH
jgi:hypothetical protein